ncbi:MAG: endonuclease [Lachnospiraceae bacterium]|nr:endonuclease [Lachnospiraceae bacterium]
MKTLKKILRIVLIVLLAAVLLAGGLLGYLTLTEYAPEETAVLTAQGSGEKTLSAGQTLRLVSWNIGYGALGDNADFFMDGGKGVNTADVPRVTQNMEAVLAFLRDQAPDIVFLQEADVNSSRSHGIDETALVSEAFPGYQHSFAYNFNVSFVPFPLPPIGHVESGLFTMTAFSAASVVRRSLPCPFSWPLRTANLKRCLMVSRFSIDGSDKELVLVNLHLEAYDDGEGKTEQTRVLRELLESEWQKGNYVIAGGDFNQTLSTIDLSRFAPQEGKWQPGILDVSGFGEGWQFFMDQNVPSCRSLDQPYAGADRETFQYYIIDGFIVSPNIRVSSFSAGDLDFRASDHNPTVLEFTLISPDAP